ncbi:zinc finger protein, putative [Plasmodium gallinaceum]|uniref:Zinc finger protein, putative n=1 Tax=Plasmodium gallinaceum TaxID=5849 RepID=A0A1J1GV12_PLAGA|nr:zinc finger protein, putative [Plasmodium gallinaceum]CRG94881.1 zinc finger protein, putative [Plasmodium gallinaceum]
MVYATLLSEEDLSRFRTKQCKRLLNGGCNFGLDRCQYSHNEFWNRRCPFYLSDSSFIRYITIMCPDVETKSDGSINSLCLRGGECPFAHSSEEILYHPLFYKTKRCEDYKKGSCNTYYCPFIHGLAETRVPGNYKLPFTNGINIPSIPNVIIVDKIDICNKNSNGLINDKYVKSFSLKKKSDLKLEDMNDNDVHSNKMNAMTSTAYSSVDSISNKNDIPKINIGKIALSFNDNLLNYSEEDLKLNLFNNTPFENLNNYTRSRIKNSINSFANFDANSNNTNNSNIYSSNYNELISNKMNGFTAKNGNNFSISSNISNNIIDSLSANQNFNNFNTLKLKQNHSSCSTAAHEINFNEQEATSDDINDDEDDYLDNEENLNTLIQNKKCDSESLNSDSKLNCNLNSTENDKNSEINLLEVIKCLKTLYDKIIKGNLVFTQEQWDNIAQIAYEIIGVVEFNRVLKLKKTANKIKNDVYNKNKEFLFDELKKNEKEREKENGEIKRKDHAFLIENKKDYTNEFMEYDSEKDKMINKINNELDKKKDININGAMDTEENSIVNFYHQQVKENYLDEKNEKDLLSIKRKFQTSPVTSNNDNNEKETDNLDNKIPNFKDNYFLEYYNLNKNNVSSTLEMKDNNEKLPSQQQFVSFFSFLSE